MDDVFTLKLHYGGTWKLLDDGGYAPVGFKNRSFPFVRDDANLIYLEDLYTDYIEFPPAEDPNFDALMHELQPVQVKRMETKEDIFNLFERAGSDRVIELYVARSAHEESTHEVLENEPLPSSDDNYRSSESSQSDDEDVEDEKGEIMSTNLDSPDMSIGTKFANIDVFKLALSQYAVMNEFRVKYIKSEPKRVTLQCYEHDCKWRLHASRIRDEATFQIRTLQEEHTCVSMNKNSNTMATQFWIAEKCAPWLRNEGDLSIKEIARRLNSTYHLQLPYQRIYRGKKLAFEAMHGTWVDMYGRVPDLRAELLAIGPMPDKSQWRRLGFQLFPPKVRRPPGRPRKNRLRDPDSPKKITRVHTCGRCGEGGHHSNSCKNAINTNIASGSSERRPPGRPKKGRQQHPTAPLPTQTSQEVSSSGAVLSHTNVPSTQTSQVHSESVEGRQEPRGRGRGRGSGRSRGMDQIWRL